MARPRNIRKAIKNAKGPIRRAFLEAVRDKKLSIQDIEAAVQGDGDLEQMLALNERDLDGVTESVREAFKAGGSVEGGVSMQSESAKRFIDERSSELVTAVTEGQREAIREALEAGQVLEQNPRETALDIAGRVGKSGRREGGIVGLNGQQANAVSNAKENLRSGDPDRMRMYLNNKRRDRRYDHIVNKAIKAEKPVNKDDLETITTRYQDRLLQTRGETIARTESLEATSAGRMESITQQKVSGELGDVEVIKEWVHGGGGNSRDQHLAMDGEQVPQDEPFILPDGTRMEYPGDSSAPAEHTVNCRCTFTTRTRPKS